MNPDVQAALTFQLSTLTRVVAVPTGDLGYGTDLSCTTDVTATLDEVDPRSPTAIVEAIIRRYITPRGGLIDDQDYGLDVRAHCNRGITRQELRALSGSLQGEAQKDDRVSSATVQVTAAVNSNRLGIEAQITPADPDLKPFSSTFAVTDASVLVETITRGRSNL